MKFSDKHDDGVKFPPLAVAAGVILGIVLFFVLSASTIDFVPEDGALVMQGAKHGDDREFEGMTVSSGEPEVVLAALGNFRQQGFRTVLLIGNSQLYRINVIKPGDHSTVTYLDNMAADHGDDTRYVEFSIPNGNFNEYLAFYLYLEEQSALPDRLIINYTYDDLRGQNVRESLMPYIPEIAHTETQPSPAGEGFKNLAAEQERYLAEQVNDDRTTGGRTPQETAEDAITGALDSHSPLYAGRHPLRAWIHFQTYRLSHEFLYLYRRARKADTLDQQNEVAKSLVPDNQNEWNTAAFDTLLALARADGVPLLVYRSPHPEYKGPFYHNRKKYDVHFAELEKKLQATGADYLDIEGAVPPQYWAIHGGVYGQFGSVDYFHYTAEGHKLVAEKLYEFINKNKD